MLTRMPVLIFFVAFTFAGCAAIPKMKTGPDVRATGSLATSQSFIAPAIDFPNDQWWSQFNDPELSMLITEGLAQSPDLAAAAARIRAASELVRQAHSTLSPSFFADASAGGQKSSQNQGFPPEFIPDNIQGQGRIAGNFNFNIDLWGKNHAALAAATSQAQAVRVDAAQVRLILSTAIARNYFDFRRLYAQSDATLEILRINTATETLTSERVENGLETLGALRQAQSRTARSRGNVAALDEAISLSRNALAALMGAGPDRGLKITPPMQPKIMPVGLPENLPFNLIGRRPDIVAARLRSEAAAARIKVAHTDFYPSVNLSAVAGLQSIGLGALFKNSSTFTNFGPALRLPIFDGGNIKGRYRGARAKYDEAIAQYNATLVAAFREVADAITRKRAQGKQLKAAQQSYEAGLDAYRIMNLRYRSGLANQLQLLSAEDAMTVAKQQYVTIQSRDALLDVALIRALGGGFTEASSTLSEPGND